LVKIKINSPNPVNQNLTLVGDVGDLAGSTSAKAGWKENNKTLNLNYNYWVTLQSNGYTFTSISITKQ
jgi:hypothetical protein